MAIIGLVACNKLYNIWRNRLTVDITCTSKPLFSSQSAMLFAGRIDWCGYYQNLIVENPHLGTLYTHIKFHDEYALIYVSYTVSSSKAIITVDTVFINETKRQ